jgi:hypothetical protein
MFKKLLTGLIAFALAATTLGFTSVAVFAKTNPVKGVAVSDLRFVAPQIDWLKTSKSMHNVVTKNGRSYVYFDLTKAQETAWKNGDLAMYRFNSTTHSWVKLPAFVIHMDTRNIGLSVGAGFRIAANATRFGIYGLAELR